MRSNNILTKQTGGNKLQRESWGWDVSNLLKEWVGSFHTGCMRFSFSKFYSCFSFNIYERSSGKQTMRLLSGLFRETRSPKLPVKETFALRHVNTYTNIVWKSRSSDCVNINSAIVNPWMANRSAKTQVSSPWHDFSLSELDSKMLKIIKEECVE